MHKQAFIRFAEENQFAVRISFNSGFVTSLLDDGRWEKKCVTRGNRGKKRNLGHHATKQNMRDIDLE